MTPEPDVPEAVRAMVERTAGRVDSELTAPAGREAAVVDATDEPGRSPRRGWLVAAVAALVVGLAGVVVVARSGHDPEGRTTAATTAPPPTSAGPSQELGSQIRADCARPPTGVPVDADFAFAGTVTGVDRAPTPSEEDDVPFGRWTLSVDEWFSAPGPAVVTVPLGWGSEVVVGPDGERTSLGVGDRLLLSGMRSDDDAPWGDLPYEPGLCGYSRTYDEPTAHVWRAAFRVGGVQDPDPPYVLDLPDGTGLTVDLDLPGGASPPLIGTFVRIDGPQPNAPLTMEAHPAGSPGRAVQRGIDRWTGPWGSEARLVEVEGGLVEIRLDHHGFRLSVVVPSGTTPLDARALVAALSIQDGPQGWPVVSPRGDVGIGATLDLGDGQPLLSLLREPCTGDEVEPDPDAELAPAFSRCFSDLGILAHVQATSEGADGAARELLETVELEGVG